MKYEEIHTRIISFPLTIALKNSFLPLPFAPGLLNPLPDHLHNCLSGRKGAIFDLPEGCLFLRFAGVLTCKIDKHFARD